MSNTFKHVHNYLSSVALVMTQHAHKVTTVLLAMLQRAPYGYYTFFMLLERCKNASLVLQAFKVIQFKLNSLQKISLNYFTAFNFLVVFMLIISKYVLNTLV